MPTEGELPPSLVSNQFYSLEKSQDFLFATHEKFGDFEFIFGIRGPKLAGCGVKNRLTPKGPKYFFLAT